MVADNFHHLDTGHELGSFATLELAVGACKRVVDEYLASAFRQGMSSEELYRSYSSFGDDPYVVGQGVTGVPFLAWEYARRRCDVICGGVGSDLD